MAFFSVVLAMLGIVAGTEGESRHFSRRVLRATTESFLAATKGAEADAEI
jgi:hypothetical protein